MRSASFRTLLAIATGAVLPVFVVTQAAHAGEPLQDDSRALVQTFATQLQSALQTAMSEGGPVAAVAVCKDQAPQIAARLSRQSGAKVARVSRRFRNPANAPEAWQTDVLTGFQSDLAAGRPLEEHFETDGNTSRYVKAIQVQPLCLICHGANIDSGLRATLAESYPYDRATGYAVGDLRGAFSVTWMRGESVAEPPR